MKFYYQIIKDSKFLFKFEKIVLHFMAKIFQMKPPTALSKTKKTETHDFEITLLSTIDSTNKEIRHILKKISDDLANLREAHEENEKNELILLKWKFSSMILDRFFFCLTLLYIIISFVCIIMTSPVFYKLQ